MNSSSRCWVATSTFVVDDGLKGLGRRSSLALAGAGVSGVATIAVVLVAARTLPEIAAGEFFVAIAIFAIAQGLASLGAETGLQYFLPTVAPKRARPMVGYVLLSSAALGVVLGLVVFRNASSLGELFADDGSGTSGTTDVIRLIALVLPFAGVYEVSIGALLASDEIRVSTVLDRVARPLAQVAAMVAVAANGGGSIGMVLAWSVPIVVTALIALVLLRRAELGRPEGHTDEVTPAQFIRYTWPRSIARVAQVMTQRLDVLILAAVFSIEAAAVYAAVSRCMIAGVFVASALRQTIQPQLRRLIILGDRSAVKTMYGASTTWLVLVTWPVYLVMITNAPIVMSIFGPNYETGSGALVILSTAMLVASACGLVDVVLLMLGRSWLSTINVLIALALNLVLNLALAPTWGMIGSAIAWMAAIFAANLIPLAQTSRVGLHPGGRPLRTGCTVAVITIALPMSITRVMFGEEWTPFLIGLVSSFTLYAVGLYVVRRRVLLDALIRDLKPRSATAIVS